MAPAVALAGMAIREYLRQQPTRQDNQAVDNVKLAA
jgi:hypothetical protein